MSRKYLNYSIYKRPGSPFWYGNIADEQAKSGRARFPTKIEAIEENKELALEIARNEYYKRLKENKLGVVEKRKITLKQAYDTYLSYEKPKLAQGAIEGVYSSRAAFTHYFTENIALNDITTSGVASFIRDIKKINKKTKERDLEYANASKNRYVDVFQRVINFLKPFDEIELPNISFEGTNLPEPDSKENDISLEQLVLLLEQLADHQRPIVLFAVLTGLRKASILSLRWEQINLFGRVINLKAKGRKKGGKNITIPISGALEKLLIDLKPQKDGYVFLYQGKPIKSTKTSFNKAKERAGLSFLTFHGLRHTFGCFLVEHSDIKDVQDAMHHSDVRTTLRYARRKQEKLRDQLNNNSNFVQIGHNLRVVK